MTSIDWFGTRKLMLAREKFDVLQRSALLATLVCTLMVASSASANASSFAHTGPQPMTQSVPGTSGGKFAAVSCSAAQFCIAVGQNASGKPVTDTRSGTTWGGPKVVSVIGSKGSLNGIKCFSKSSCIAVGGDTKGPIVATWTAGRWITQEIVTTSGGSFQSVSCPTIHWCAAAGSAPPNGGVFGGFYATMTNGVWSHSTIPVAAPGNPVYPDYLGYVSSVSCSSAGNCTIFGEYGVGGTYIGGFVALLQHSLLQPATQLSTDTDSEYTSWAISCTSAVNCVAIGHQRKYTPGLQQYAGAITEVNGVWGSFVQFPGQNGTDRGLSVSCTSTGNCVATGGDAVGAVSWTESSGTWGSLVRLGSNGGYLWGVSCSTSKTCLAVGQDKKAADFVSI